jgi:deoxyribonuclease-4
MLRLGIHVSIGRKIEDAVDAALERGCSTMQLFTRNPRGWRSKPIEPGVAESFKSKLRGSDIDPVFSHMPYLPNLASPRRNIYDLSVKALIDEAERCAELGISYIVAHLGSHLGFGKEAGLKRVIAALDSAIFESKGAVTILLENTAGTRNSVGSTFEDIGRVLEGVSDQKHLGVCFDTCHAFASGYDLATHEAVERTLKLFDEFIGLNRLMLVHLNDSYGGLRSHIDRHEHIGLGKIGETGFISILSSPLGRLPIILETPIDDRRSDLGNIQKVRELVALARDSFGRSELGGGLIK